jgi:hypothetical protein
MWLKSIRDLTVQYCVLVAVPVAHHAEMKSSPHYFVSELLQLNINSAGALLVLKCSALFFAVLFCIAIPTPCGPDLALRFVQRLRSLSAGDSNVGVHEQNQVPEAATSAEEAANLKCCRHFCPKFCRTTVRTSFFCVQCVCGCGAFQDQLGDKPLVGHPAPLLACLSFLSSLGGGGFPHRP